MAEVNREQLIEDLYSLWQKPIRSRNEALIGSELPELVALLGEDTAGASVRSVVKHLQSSLATLQPKFIRIPFKHIWDLDPDLTQLGVGAREDSAAESWAAEHLRLIQREKDRYKSYAPRAKGTLRSEKTRRTLCAIFADHLINNQDDGDSPPLLSVVKVAADEPTVRRPDLEQRLSVALQSGAVINLHGEPGNGKTFAARRVLAGLVDADRVVVLRETRSPDSHLYHSDLVEALRRIGVECQSWTVPALELELRQRLRQADGGLPAVLVDDADQAAVDRLIDSPVSTVLLTSRHQLFIAGGASVRVGAYLPAEASVALGRLCPSLDADQRDKAVQSVGLRPQPIDVLGRALQREETTVEAFFSAMERVGVAAIDHLSAVIGDEPGARGIVVTYAQAYQALESDSDLSLDLLHALIWLSGSSELAAVLALTEAAEGLSTDDLVVRASLKRLELMGLVVLSESGVEVNDLTALAIRQASLAHQEPLISRLLTRLAAAGHLLESPVLTLKITGGSGDYLNMFAAQLFMVDMQLERLVGATSTGCIRTGCWLYWFEDERGDRRLYSRLPGIPRSANHSVVAASELAGRYRRDLEWAVFARICSPIENELSREPVRFDYVLENARPNVRHVLISLIQPGAAQMMNLRVWSLCGVSATDPGAGAPSCPECLDRSLLHDRVQRLLWSAEVLNALPTTVGEANLYGVLELVNLRCGLSTDYYYQPDVQQLLDSVMLLLNDEDRSLLRAELALGLVQKHLVLNLPNVAAAADDLAVALHDVMGADELSGEVSRETAHLLSVAKRAFLLLSEADHEQQKRYLFAKRYNLSDADYLKWADASWGEMSLSGWEVADDEDGPDGASDGKLVLIVDESAAALLSDERT